MAFEPTLGFDVRELNPEEAANTAEARGRRAVLAANRGTIGATPTPEQPQLSQAAPQVQQGRGETTARPQGQPTQRSGESDTFGSFVDILLNVLSFGIRPLVKERLARDRRAQAAQDYDTVTAATQNMQTLFGGLNRGPERTAAAEAHIAQLEQSFPGLGMPVKAAWDAVENQGVNLPAAMEHRDKALAFCGTGANAQTCINKLFSDEKLIQQWNDDEDQNRLPDIMEQFNQIVEAARQGGGEDILTQLAENGWDLAELRRLPEEFAFTENQLRTINRNEDIQNSLISVGLNPASLDVEREKAEIKERAKAKFREPATTPLGRLQKQLEQQLAEGNLKAAQETQKLITKMGTIVGRTPEDVRTGLEGAIPKDIDELRAGIRDLQGNLEELEKTRKNFEDNPEAGGILGTALESAGGILGQIPFIGGDLAEMLPGDQEKIKKARTQARFTVASMLTTITKEETGRFTDKERAIAQEAVGALDVTASPPQIQAALETAIEIMTASQNRKVDELLSAAQLNLADSSDLEKFNKILLENRFTQDQADDAILDVMERRGITLE